MSNELQRADKGFAGVLRAMVMSSTDRVNSIHRNVAEYRPCGVEAFFDPARGVYNSIVSGGNEELRVSAMIAQAICASQNGFPVIVLHEGNRWLEQQLRSNFSGSGKYIEVSATSPCFEPFYGLNELEIANQILETAPKDYDIKFSARYYIEGVSQVLKRSRKHLSFKMFSTCPHALIFDKVDDLRMQNVISDAEEQEIKSKLMMGQSENYKLDTFLASLKMEIEPFMYMTKGGHPPVNIVSAVRQNSVLCFDISSVTNRLLLNTLMYQLKLALTKGLQYTIIIDSIPINSNEAYASFIKSPTDKIGKMIASDDFYAMVGSDDKVFAAAVGDSQILIVMGHRAGHSAMKWAEVFGQYDKYEETYSRSRGKSKRTPFSLFSSPSYQNSVSISKNREYIVKPEVIARMGASEAYVLSAARGELAHLMLTV